MHAALRNSRLWNYLDQSRRNRCFLSVVSVATSILCGSTCTGVIIAVYACTHSHCTFSLSCMKQFLRADPKWDQNTLTLYYTTVDPDDPSLNGNLFISNPPYTTHQQFDPKFGSHDAFLVHGPYIFAQRTDDGGKINLYVSHLRGPFRLAKIPTPYNHQNYLVSNIDELLAMVIIQHDGGFYNLYLSDTTGVDYALSLRDIVVERGNILDLEIVSWTHVVHYNLWSVLLV